MPDTAGEARPATRPAAYFLTFACYGARLHGDYQFAVDRNHNGYKGRYAPLSAGLARYEREALLQEPYLLSENASRVTLASIRRTCEYEQFLLHAAHVHSNHAHVVADADCPPETLLGKLKAYASRALNQADGAKRKRWARHGSTIWLWTPQDVDMAVDYVVNHQGEPIARYENPNGRNV